MKKRLVNGKGAIVTHNESAEIAKPSESALHGPASFVAAQRSAVLRGRLAPVFAVRHDQLDAACRQLPAQRIAIVAAVGNQAKRLLPRTPGSMPSSYADARQRCFD